MNKIVLSVGATVYLAGAIVTAGYGFNRPCYYERVIDLREGRAFSVLELQPDGCSLAEHNAVLGSLVWPIYWGIRGAMEITKPEGGTA